MRGCNPFVKKFYSIAKIPRREDQKGRFYVGLEASPNDKADMLAGRYQYISGRVEKYDIASLHLHCTEGFG